MNKAARDIIEYIIEYNEFMAIRYYDKLSDKYYTEATIQSNLSKAYKEHYTFEPKGACEGCGAPATCTAHIIPKSQLKILGLTSIIWNPEVWFRSCYVCNQRAENPQSEDIKKLLNYDRIVEVTKKYDYQRYLKMTL